MTRPVIRNVCPGRQVLDVDAGGWRQLPHETLMIRQQQPIGLADIGPIPKGGVVAPTIGSNVPAEVPLVSFVEYRSAFQDVDGEQFSIRARICRYCGGLFTVVEDVTVIDLSEDENPF